MNRRNFILSILATSVLDPEKLLWVPGKKKIFIPSPSLNMSHIIAIEWDQLRKRMPILFYIESSLFNAIGRKNN